MQTYCTENFIYNSNHSSLQAEHKKKILLPLYLEFPSVLIWQITCLSQCHQSSFLLQEQMPPQLPVKTEKGISMQLGNQINSIIQNL